MYFLKSSSLRFYPLTPSICKAVLLQKALQLPPFAFLQVSYRYWILFDVEKPGLSLGKDLIIFQVSQEAR
jgi:hypothetical protein